MKQNTKEDDGVVVVSFLPLPSAILKMKEK